MWIPDRNYLQFAQFSHNTLCWPPKVLHSLCVSFLLGIRVVLREIEDNAYAKFRGENKVYYGRCANGKLVNWDTELAWENSQHLVTVPLVSPQNDVWETWAEIPYWWHVTTQIWVVSWQCQIPRQLLKNNNSCQFCS